MKLINNCLILCEPMNIMNCLEQWFIFDLVIFSYWFENFRFSLGCVFPADGVIWPASSSGNDDFELLTEFFWQGSLKHFLVEF